MRFLACGRRKQQPDHLKKVAKILRQILFGRHRAAGAGSAGRFD